jgi:mRNA interferase HigB
MRIIAKRTIREFWEKHPGSEEALRTWFRESSGRRRYNQNQLKDHFGHIRILGANRIIFNICGNKYRLIVEVNYPRGWFFIRFIGTHTEYDRIDPKTI